MTFLWTFVCFQLSQHKHKVSVNINAHILNGQLTKKKPGLRFDVSAFDAEDIQYKFFFRFLVTTMSTRWKHGVLRQTTRKNIFFKYRRDNRQQDQKRLRFITNRNNRRLQRF